MRAIFRHFRYQPPFQQFNRVIFRQDARRDHLVILLDTQPVRWHIGCFFHWRLNGHNTRSLTRLLPPLYLHLPGVSRIRPHGRIFPAAR
jgi:hypothetical protein